jgi:predicted DNA-binding protein (MmcQ/YjbR family)
MKEITNGYHMDSDMATAWISMVIDYDILMDTNG